MANNTSISKTVLQGLYYPAILGSVLVLWLYKFARHDSIADAAFDCTLYFGVLGLLYFSACFVMMNDRSYNSWHVLLDSIEIIVIFTAFYFIGYFTPDNPAMVNWTAFYYIMICSPVLALLWNVAARFWNLTHNLLAVIAIIVFILGANLHQYGLWIHRIVCIFLLAIILVYFIKFSKTIELE